MPVFWAKNQYAKTGIVLGMSLKFWCQKTMINTAHFGERELMRPWSDRCEQSNCEIDNEIVNPGLADGLHGAILRDMIALKRF